MKYIKVTCVDCGRKRNVRTRDNEPIPQRCRSCNMKTLSGSECCGLSHVWKGGKTRRAGYVAVKLPQGDFFYSMIQKDGYVLEHRLVMAKYLGRCLNSWEIVHHKNGIKTDNSIENLQLVTEGQHNQITILERRIKSLEVVVEKQGISIKLLLWQLNGMSQIESTLTTE